MFPSSFLALSALNYIEFVKDTIDASQVCFRFQINNCDLKLPLSKGTVGPKLRLNLELFDPCKIYIRNCSNVWENFSSLAQVPTADILLARGGGTAEYLSSKDRKEKINQSLFANAISQVNKKKNNKQQNIRSSYEPLKYVLVSMSHMIPGTS